MANKNLFQAVVGKLLPKPNATNEAGAPAYAFEPKQALAQYAATGCLNSTFYATADEQLSKVLELCNGIETSFIARTAVFCREKGRMKDMPALLCAVLATKDTALLEVIFPRVIDNGRMLRNFVQIVRSGVVGRKSLGTAPRRMIRRWLAEESDVGLLRASVGQSPSLGDVIKMVHPKPKGAVREAMYAYLIGRTCKMESLPAVVTSLEAFKAGKTLEVPQVPFEMLTALPLSKSDWTEVARNASWQMTRMNLNTFARHDVFGNDGAEQSETEREITKTVAERLRDRKAIEKARVFPYQLMVAYTSAGRRVPALVREALQDAMEIAIENVPAVSGKAYVLLDVSGSMHSAVTGSRGSATSAVRCLDAAALIAAAVVRKNQTSEVVPFNDKVVPVNLNPRDSVMTNAALLAALPQGGTNCSAPLAMLNARKAEGDLVIYVSDNQSWVDAQGAAARGTATMAEWSRFKARNEDAKLVCIDLQPYGSSQAAERQDVLNVGGFSDQVFETVATFAAGQLGGAHWVGEIERVEI